MSWAIFAVVGAALVSLMLIPELLLVWLFLHVKAML